MCIRDRHRDRSLIGKPLVDYLCKGCPAPLLHPLYRIPYLEKGRSIRPQARGKSRRQFVQLADDDIGFDIPGIEHEIRLTFDPNGAQTGSFGTDDIPSVTGYQPGIPRRAARAPVSYTHLDVYKRQVHR